MKKIFLIPLLTLVCSVMAFAQNEAKIGDTEYATLKAAIDAASSGETIELLKDVSYIDLTGSAPLNINKSLTIKGYGHTISGYSWRSGKAQFATIWINLVDPSTSNIDVIFDDVRIVNPRNAKTKIGTKSYALGNGSDWAIHTRGMIGTITIKDSYLEAYSTALQIGGNQASVANVIASNDTLNARKYYAVVSYNPYNMTISDSYVHGWAALYFKGIDGSAGSRYSSVEATNCTFWCHNVYSGASNAFGAFVLEDDGINITLDNCQVDCTQEGDQDQAVFCLSDWATRAAYAAYYHYDLEPCQFTVRGADTEVIGNILTNKWNGTENECPITFFFYGGTYDDNIEAKIAGGVPSGFHVNALPTVKGGEEITLYRVVKDAEVTDINAGSTEGKSVEVASSSVLEENTEAGYVIVTGDNTQLTVPAGKEFEVTNGLDVTDGAQVVVEAGSTLIVGEGGVTAEDVESIVIEANENGAASFLLSPDVAINTTPNLTVRMKASQIGRDADGDFYWHRFAMPVAHIETWEKEGSLVGTTYPTYLYGWDYTANAWDNNAPNEMLPLQGYTLTLASDYIDGAAADGKLNVRQDVTYIFKGNLFGNTNQPLNFQAEGFNFFGNSYTGYMDVKTMLQGLADEHIDGTAYMWNSEEQIYQGVSLTKLIKGRGLEDWQKEVAPMQTFILRLRGADSAEESVNYAASIWGNPNRYGNNSNSGAGAPRRNVAAISEDTYMEISVKAANGMSSSVDFAESANNSDAFESGYDVEKYMNEKRVNLFATVEGMNLSSVVTDNIEGKTLSLQTNGELAYTMTFKNVEGEEYAIRDNVTGRVIAIEEGATYEFAAQPNSLVENRFEIIPAAKMPTAIDDVEVKANVKGIYTIMGQYLGENFNILPAGVYVVDGVKIVK